MNKVSIFLVLLAFVIGCGPSISVNHDYDPAYNFTTLKTYDWLKITEPQQASELVIKRFMNAIDNEMTTKGMTKVSENPDFLIAVQGLTETKTDVTNYGYGGGYGYGYGPYGGWGAGGVDISTYKEGTVLLDFVDAKTKAMFWRGTATAIAEPGLSAEKQEQKFALAASKLLSQFPPTAKK